ncbi:MAG: nucleotidyltransferase [Clostridia bacterium]|nr:nucleotidyltransferase [Clostridia bacterium]
MGNVLGIIAEYNPFHNGHLHHLIESKKITNSDSCIAIMSGNFTQRGEVSIVDKWTKAQMAIENGIDLVIELPTLYAISSAENFASGAIKILNSLGIVDFVSFGSECNDISILDDIANVLAFEPSEYKTLLSHELARGESFPKARENALMMYLNNIRRFANVLSAPNNILGIEYLKSLKRQKSKIQPITIKREGSKYNDDTIPRGSRYASATAIRNLCQATDDITPIQRFVPESTFDILEENIKKGNCVKSLSCFDKEILYTLRKMSTDEIANLPDVSEGLEFALKSAANQCNSVVELLSIINTKRYTKTRLQRILLYAILGITKQDMKMSILTTPYVRVLGFNDKGQELISQISKKNKKLEIITSVKKFIDKKSSDNLKLLMEKDIWATDVYTLGFEYESKANLDYTHKLII